MVLIALVLIDWKGNPNNGTTKTQRSGLVNARPGQSGAHGRSRGLELWR